MRNLPFSMYDLEQRPCYENQEPVLACRKIVSRKTGTPRINIESIKAKGDKSRCESCGECVVRCPVGALVPKNIPTPSSEPG